MSYNVYHQVAFDIPTRTVRYHLSEKGWHERDEWVVTEEEVQKSAKELGVTPDEAFLYRNVIYFLGAGDVRNSVSVRIRRGLAAAQERLQSLDPDARAEAWDFMSGNYDAAPHVVSGVVRAFMEAYARREPRDEHVVVTSGYLSFNGKVACFKAPSRGGRSYITGDLQRARRYPNAFEAQAAIRAGYGPKSVAVPIRELSAAPSEKELSSFLKS